MKAPGGHERAADNFFEDEIAVPVMGKLPKNLGNRYPCVAQFAQDPGFVPDERVAISPIPVSFTITPAFFDDHVTERPNGEIERVVNASFAALSFGAEDQKLPGD